MFLKTGFIGAGNMAGAIISGILKTGCAKPDEIAVTNRSREKLEKFKGLGVNVFYNSVELAGFSDIIFLAVKPQNYDDVLSVLTGHTHAKVIVSLAPGISAGYLKSLLGDDTKIVRAMPNTPLMLGLGATALSRGDHLSDAEFNAVKHVFEAGGIVQIVPEDKVDAVISVSGSSPAYVYLFAKAVVEGAAEQGIDGDTALKLFAKVLEGSAKMLTDSGYSADELIRMVSSPGGTTLKALEALYENGFENTITEAMRRCSKRAEELSR